MTAFLAPEAADAIDALRRVWCPSLASLIAPHVTVVHAVADPQRAAAILAGLVARLEPAPLRLGDTACWNTPEAGIYVSCSVVGAAFDRIREAFDRIREALGAEPADGTQFVPHATVLHPRYCPSREFAARAWAELGGKRLNLEVTIREVALIRSDGGAWSTIAAFRLGSSSS